MGKNIISVKEGDITTYYITPKVKVGYELIRYGKNLGLPPQQTHKEMKGHGLNSDELRDSLKVFLAVKNGAKVDSMAMLPSYAGG
jgi:hypothetical protein